MMGHDSTGAFALLEATLLLASIVQRVKLAPVEGPRVVPYARITLRPRLGMAMSVSSR
jgi:cytochrome P450